jgi:hypothetical protein
MATPDPYWTDGRGNRLPKKPCPKCGANVGPMPLRVENLRHLGWQPYTVQSYQSWCGHTQEIIPFPRGSGRRMIGIRKTPAATYATAYRRHSPGTPFRLWTPRSSNRSPEPATRSLTVWETRTSPGPATETTRAPT